MGTKRSKTTGGRTGWVKVNEKVRRIQCSGVLLHTRCFSFVGMVGIYVKLYTRFLL